MGHPKVRFTLKVCKVIVTSDYFLITQVNTWPNCNESHYTDGGQYEESEYAVLIVMTRTVVMLEPMCV